MPITDYRMSRFWISLDQGVELVIKALEEAKGGETFISKIPSFYVKDLAEALLPGCKTVEVGIRPGEKRASLRILQCAAPLSGSRSLILQPQRQCLPDQCTDGNNIILSGGPAGRLQLPEYSYDPLSS